MVPLPADDVNGASLGFLTQALALGGTIASVGLGRLIPRTRRSWRRGLGHLGTLIVYALGSAAVVLWSMTWFGVGVIVSSSDTNEVLGLSDTIATFYRGTQTAIKPAGEWTEQELVREVMHREEALA